MNDQKQTPRYSCSGTPGDSIGIAELWNSVVRNEAPIDGFELATIDDQTLMVVHHDDVRKVATFYVADFFSPPTCGMSGDALDDLSLDVEELLESTKEIEESARLVEKQASTLKRRQAHLAIVARHRRVIDGIGKLVQNAKTLRCIDPDEIAHVTVFARRILDEVPA